MPPLTHVIANDEAESVQLEIDGFHFDLLLLLLFSEQIENVTTNWVIRTKVP